MEHGILAVAFLGGSQVDVHRLVTDERLFHEDRPAGTLLQRNPRTAKRPSRARGHVYLDTVLAALLLGEAQHFHPFVGEIGYVVLVVALHAVEGCNLQRTYSVLGILLHVPLQVLLVNGRTQPPPAGTRLSLGFCHGPLLGCNHQGESQEN